MSVACGNKSHDRDLSKVHHHDSVAQVKLCFARGGLASIEEQAADEEGHQQALADLAAERATERWFEERGGGTYAGSEEEARDRYFDSLNWEQAIASEQPGQQAEGAPESPRKPLKDGVYTLVKGDGHRTFRVRTQESEAKFKPGVQILSFLSGQINDFANGDYTQFGEIRPNGSLHVWAKHRGNTSVVSDAQTFLSDPEGPNVEAAVHCFRCHALLTVPESVQSGWGPECRKMGLR